jgi:hypothetical protein
LRQAGEAGRAGDPDPACLPSGMLKELIHDCSTHSIQLIALNKLVVSPRNVRGRIAKADIDALAASIASHGLLQNLCVVDRERQI